MEVAFQTKWRADGELDTGRCSLESENRGEKVSSNFFSPSRSSHTLNQLNVTAPRGERLCEEAQIPSSSAFYGAPRHPLLVFIVRLKSWGFSFLRNFHHLSDVG